MKTSKRLLSLLLALTMVLSLMGNLSVAAFADDEPQPTEATSSESEKTPDANPDANSEGGNPDANPEGGNPDANPDANPEGGNSEGDKNDTQNEEKPAADEEETTVAAVPTRKAEYPAESSDTAKTGTAYLLSDLQNGKIFAPVEGQTLTYENYYYERSEDGGQTWSAKMKFEKALFGATLIQITETKAGVYTYRFYASHDGENFSTDIWTLTLTVEDNPTMNFTFYVGKDYTGSYPVIKLYNVATGADGNETLGDEIENAFLYSNFTDTLPEGEESYDPANGKLDNNYQMFYAKLTAGRYAYRAFTADGKALGGMTLDLPTDANVDGGTGGGNSIYLQCVSFYTNSRKADNTYFTAEEYHVRVTCPIMKCDTVMGAPYTSGNFAYYPTMLYAAGNACLYNSYFYPTDTKTYSFSQNINQTFTAGWRSTTKMGSINTLIELTVTVPADATFGLYFQWNNFNTTEVAPIWGDEEAPYADRWTVNGSTKTATYFISKGNSNYTWRLSDDKHVTQAGWLANQSANAELTFDFAENAATDRVSHDFSNLGTQTSKRDEADLQINLDPSGYEAISGTTRVRAYRHWQLINSDAGNIMVEPDFHWNTLSGDADIATVNGGNTTANWADITPGTEDSIIAVYYDSVDVNPGNYGSHGGLFPATNPERVGVIVVGGTGVTHGTADADVDFNMAAGAATTRSMDWDYNYDTWFYEASEKNPALDFAVKATGDVTVEYAFVTTNSGMTSTLSGFTAVNPGADGRYTVALNAFNTAGTNGGTVIIKMTDSTGVSYRLVRVAKVTINAENVSNPGEDIMPGDQVKLTFDGMYRAVNKISGIFNPTTFKPTYYAGNTKYEGTLGQYQRMDNATVTVTIPEDVTFADGASTAEYALTNGYTFGSMYSAANPFAFLYNMTDTGVGTNFNAVTVSYYMNHYADAVVTVHQKATYAVKLNITDEDGKTIEGVTITLRDRNGNEVAANEDGTYTLGYGPYTYTMAKSGFVTTRGSFTLGSVDAAKVQEGVLPVATSAMAATGDSAWDGKTATEPATDDSGVYQIGTAAELAWFAANGGKASAKLTADIELTGYDWTPMRNFYGTFDGDGHIVKNLYINSATDPLGLFGYLKKGAKVTNLGITGNVTCTAKSNAQAGGIVGYMEEGTAIENCYSAVNVTSAKHGGGIAGYTNAGSNANITSCYASGDIATSSTNECFLGGIAATGWNQHDGATLVDCYSIGKVTGSGGNASYLGGLSPNTAEDGYVGNCFYLENTVTGESPKYNITGKGTAKTAAEMKALIAAGNHPFKDKMLEDMKTWNGKTTTEPEKDASGVYQIGTAAELAWFAKAVNEGQNKLNAVLTADIDLENNPWTPIANDTAETVTGNSTYKGTFDGNGHVVSNLYINNADSKQGLFSYVTGTIKNLGVTGSVTTTGVRAGGIAGYMVGGTIENCYSAVNVTAAKFAGGIAGGGQTTMVKITNCYNAGDVTVTNNFAGGIVSCGVSWAGGGPTVSNCYNIGTVTRTEGTAQLRIGGILCVSTKNKPVCYGKDLYYLDSTLNGQEGVGAEKCTVVDLSQMKAKVSANTNPFNDQMLAILDARIDAKAVIAKINDIGEVTLDSEQVIKEARDAYDKLTEMGKALVTNIDKLTDAEAKLAQLKKAAADKAAADAVTEKINAIGEVTLTDASKAKIDAARKAYDALTDDQKKLIDEKVLGKLTGAEAKYKELADKAAADEVIGKINAIGEVKLDKDSKDKIDAAREAYGKLTDDQKKLINEDVLKKLTDAEEKCEKLAADKKAADEVIGKINAIGEVTLTDDSKAKIDAASEAYDKLTDDQKKLIDEDVLKKLTDAEEKYEKLAADKKAADEVTGKIDAIGEVKLDKDSKDKIDAAREAYGKLTDDQKKLIDEKVLEKLTGAEAKYEKLKNQSGSGSGSSGSNKPSTSGKTDKTVKSGNTGDDSQLTLWLGGVVLSAAALALLAKKRRQDA